MTMGSNVLAPEGQVDLSRRSGQCRRYVIGAVICFFGLALGFAGVWLIGLPLFAAGIGMCKKAILQARAAALPGSPAANLAPQGPWHGLWRLATIALVVTLMALMYVLLQRPKFAASHAWVGDDYLALVAVVLVIFVVKTILTTRKVFFVEYGRVGSSAKGLGASQHLEQELRTDKFMQRTRWARYALWAMMAVAILLLFALPKNSPIAMWLVYGVVAMGGVYVLVAFAGVARGLILALIAIVRKHTAGH